MNGKEQVVIRLLQRLSDGVKLALVRARVVGLSLAGDGADKITMHTHSKAYHIDCFLNVGLPVAALLGVVNLVDDDIVLLLAVGRDVERGEPGFAAVLRAGEEVENRLFLTHDSLLLLSAVGDALGTKYGLQYFAPTSIWYLIGAEFFSFASLAMPINCLMLYHLPRNNAS